MKALITVVDEEEARKAVEGGCDILDIKNPSEGSLGANNTRKIGKIMKEVSGEVKTSIAAGDVPNLPGTVSLAVKGAAHFRPDYIKVGLKGPDDKTEAIEVMKKSVEAAKDVDENIKVVAACYADHERAGTLDPKLVPKMADKAGAQVAMIDTAIKDGKTLLDHLSRTELEEFVQEAKSRGLNAALAGSLNSEHVPEVYQTNADIFGVRGCVCPEEDREASLKKELVKDLVERIAGSGRR